MEPLTDEQVRVLGCLLEKEATVPDTYPMTLKALTQACNQASSRDPVVDYHETTVRRCLDELKAAGFARFVHPSHGARATKFRHVADERLDLDRAGLAVLGVLALRGPQTAGELRTRTERWVDFDSVDEVEAALASLAERDEPLTHELPRQPGQHQTRWVHLLGGPVDVELLGGPVDVDAISTPARDVSDTSRAPAPDDGRIAELEERVAALAARVEHLERELGLS